MCQLRGIKAVFQSAAKDKGADTLSDEECIAVLRKLAKQVLRQRTQFTCFTGTCFTGTKVEWIAVLRKLAKQVLTLLALLVQK